LRNRGIKRKEKQRELKKEEKKILEKAKIFS